MDLKRGWYYFQPPSQTKEECGLHNYWELHFFFFFAFVSLFLKVSFRNVNKKRPVPIILLSVPPKRCAILFMILMQVDKL